METIQEKPKIRIKPRRFLLNFGKLIIDGTKLCFGSLVLGTVIKGEIPQSTLLIAGIVISGVGAIIGVAMVSAFEEK